MDLSASTQAAWPTCIHVRPGRHRNHRWTGRSKHRRHPRQLCAGERERAVIGRRPGRRSASGSTLEIPMLPARSQAPSPPRPWPGRDRHCRHGIRQLSDSDSIAGGGTGRKAPGVGEGGPARDAPGRDIQQLEPRRHGWRRQGLAHLRRRRHAAAARLAAPLALAPASTVEYGKVQKNPNVPTEAGRSGTAASGRDAGTYRPVSDQQGYDIGNGELVIAPKPLDMSTSIGTKVYDGTTTATAASGQPVRQ